MKAKLDEIRQILTAPGQRFEITDTPIRGTTYRTWSQTPNSLRDILERTTKHANATYLVYEDERITYQEHLALVAKTANALIALGVKKGDRVVISMRNYPEWIISFWAISSIGAIVVPLNAWWTRQELEYGIADSMAKVVIVDPQRYSRIVPSIKGLVETFQEITILVVRSNEATFADLEIPDLSDSDNSLRILDFGKVIDNYCDLLPQVEILPDDPVTIFYTSGTTGAPKGALGTHRNICTNLISVLYISARNQMAYPSSQRTALDSNGDKQQNAYLLSVPLFHATGCHGVLIPNTFAGSKIIMMYRWNPERALELIEREKVTSFGGVPTMVWQVLNSHDFPMRDTSSVKLITYGGAPCPPELVRKIKENFPMGSPSNGYGLTETSSVATMNSGDDYLEKPDSVGLPLPVVELAVVNDSGDQLGPNQVGELIIKGPNVVNGYWNKPQATRDSFRDGWFYSGDLAYVDEEDFVYIVDRAKDMVIRGGENIYSIEVESVLYDFPGVVDAAIIGIPDLIMGEEVAAIVTCTPGITINEEDLRSYVAQHLAAFKVPKYIFFYDDLLPRNPTGKILKRQLREEVSRTILDQPSSLA